MNEPTWRHKNGLLGFAFGSAQPSKSEPADLLTRLIELLETVATIRLIAIAFTEPFEELAFVGTDSAAAIQHVHNHATALAELDIDCDLLCKEETQRQFTVPNVLHCNLEFGESNNGKVRSLLSTMIWLDVDVHVAVQWPDRDNRSIAAVNAPAFNAFLSRVPDVLGLPLEDVYSDYFNYVPALINRNGFTLVPVPL